MARSNRTVSIRMTRAYVSLKSNPGHCKQPLITSLTLFSIMSPNLFVFCMNTHLLAMGIVSRGFVTRLQVPIVLCCSSSTWIAFSHSSQSCERFASCRLAGPSFIAVVYDSSIIIIWIAIMAVSSSSSSKNRLSSRLKSRHTPLVFLGDTFELSFAGRFSGHDVSVRCMVWSNALSRLLSLASPSRTGSGICISLKSVGSVL